MQADAADIVEAAVAADRVQASWLARQGADVVELWVGRCPAEASDDAVKCAIVQHLLDEQANAYGMRDIYMIYRTSSRSTSFRSQSHPIAERNATSKAASYHMDQAAMLRYEVAKWLSISAQRQKDVS